MLEKQLDKIDKDECAALYLGSSRDDANDNRLSPETAKRYNQALVDHLERSFCKYDDW